MSKETGKIQVTVQREDRLFAINKLASAIEKLAIALSNSVEVKITDCYIKTSNTGINVDTAEEITKTLIEKMDK